MESSEKLLNQATEIYRRNCQRASVASGRIFLPCSENGIIIYPITTSWSQRDLDDKSLTNFAIQYNVRVQANEIQDIKRYHILPDETSGEIAYSESGELKAILKTVKSKTADQDKQTLSIWSKRGLLRTYDLTATKKHGKVLTEVTFSRLLWSPNEKYILYLAEKEKKKCKTSFDLNTDNEKENSEESDSAKISTKLDKFVYEETWGEREATHLPVLAILEVETGNVTVLKQISTNITPGQATWCRDSSGVVFVGWENEPWRLGILFCSNRRNNLYHASIDGSKCDKLVTDGGTIYAPRFNPQGTKLIYLRYPTAGPHHNCAKLMRIEWESKQLSTLIDTIKRPTDDGFCGIYTMVLPQRCWSKDGTKLYFHTNQRIGQEIFQVDTTNGSINCITKDNDKGCWSVLDVHDNILLASYSSPTTPARPMVAIIPPVVDEHITRLAWSEFEVLAASDDVSWKMLSFKASDDLQVKGAEFHILAELDFDALLSTPAGDTLPPLIVIPHGGPHVAFVGEFLIYCYSFCQLGFAVLQVNYRGSSGYGQDTIDVLPGRAGSLDVKDMKLATDYVLDSNVVDRDRVYVFGGSHGGFLATHLIGQFPGCFTACAVRNPVVDIASMLNVSDIPDWCYVEAGFEWNFKNIVSSDIYSTMYNNSPISHVHKVKTPTMILLGENDMRVPNCQGHEYYRALKSVDVETRLLVYPGNNHSLGEVECEADVFMNVINWFSVH